MINIQFIQANIDAKLPTYSSAEASGADVYSVASYTINPGENMLIDTGLDCVIPSGYEIQVRPRSGMALKNKITVLNTPGTIDSDYTGRIGINLINFSSEPYIVEKGARIAQLVVAPVIQANFSWTDKSRNTERGSKGFGSTGE
jgi:dUTP pyrophosphatase